MANEQEVRAFLNEIGVTISFREQDRVVKYVYVIVRGGQRSLAINPFFRDDPGWTEQVQLLLDQGMWACSLWSEMEWFGASDMWDAIVMCALAAAGSSEVSHA